MGARYTLLFYFSVGLSSLDCDFKLFRHVYFRTQKSQEHSMNSSLVFLTNSTPHGDWTTAVLGSGRARPAFQQHRCSILV